MPSFSHDELENMASEPGKKGRQSTLAFRLINPELFIKPVSIVDLNIIFLMYVCFDQDGGVHKGF